MTFLVQTGGAVPEGRAYIRRPADEQLPKAMRAGELCVLFAPRQEGKTSLMNRTLDGLAGSGTKCALIDLGLLSPGSATADEMFSFLGTEIGEVFETAFEIRSGDKVASSQFVDWLTALVEKTEEPIAIFIDEIHQLIEAPILAKRLLDSLRVLYEARARNPRLKRLSFCLAGVTRPRDLVPGENPLQDATEIRLEDFTLAELESIEGDVPIETLRAVFRWTNGHPYMTVQLLRDLAEQDFGRGEPPNAVVDQIVDRTLLSDSRARERYLTDARWLFGAPNRFGGDDLAKAVEIYRRLLRGESVKESEAGSSGVILVLCGVAAWRDRGARLEIRNKVVAKLYGESWLQEEEVTKHLDLPLQSWQARSKLANALLSGKQLELAVAVAKRAADINQDQRAFLLASLEHESQRTAETRGSELEKQVLLLTSQLKDQTASSNRERDLMQRGWTRTLFALAFTVIVLIVVIFLGSRRISRLKATALDEDDVVKELRNSGQKQSIAEQRRKQDFENLQTRAKKAALEADDAERLLSGASAFDHEDLQRKAEAARATASLLQTAADGAKRDYDDAAAATTKARENFEYAERTGETAIAMMQGLRLEVEGRQNLETILAKEQARSALLESERDGCLATASTAARPAVAPPTTVLHALLTSMLSAVKSTVSFGPQKK